MGHTPTDISACRAASLQLKTNDRDREAFKKSVGGGRILSKLKDQGLVPEA